MDRKEVIKGKILNYLQKNPDAGDKLEGITRYWLESERINQGVEEVAEALESMIVEGIVKKVKQGDGSSVFKLVSLLTTNKCDPE